jgi:CxxC motif-containing protein (DUF1111 family)
MKWFLTYALAAVVLLGPVGVRLWMRSPAVPAPLEETAVRAGKMLFTHAWTVHDPLCATGDGLGPVFNATSCAQCHFQGGLGGSGGLLQNVTTFFIEGQGNRKSVQGVVHAHAISPEYQETLASVSPAFPPLQRPTLQELLKLQATGRQILDCQVGVPVRAAVQLSQRNSPALFGAKLIDEIPDQAILANERAQKLRRRDSDNIVGRAMMLPGGRVGKFGWKAQSSSLLSFVQAACANELGLGNPGQAQPAPLTRPDYKPSGLDLSAAQCEQMTAFIASLPRPIETAPADPQGRQSATAGRQIFNRIGCAVCHVPNLGSVNGVYSDFLLHRMGQDLEGGGSYNPPPTPVPDSSGEDPLPDEWRTPPLWGVADSGPYLHDGRASSLADAIRLHGGQAKESASRFAALGPKEQGDLIRFLNSLRAPD